MSDLYAPNQQVVRPDGSGPAEKGEGGTAAEPAAAEQESSELEGMTKDELLAEADRRGVEVPSGATKAEIREALEAR